MTLCWYSWEQIGLLVKSWGIFWHLLLALLIFSFRIWGLPDSCWPIPGSTRGAALATNDCGGIHCFNTHEGHFWWEERWICSSCRKVKHFVTIWKNEVQFTPIRETEEMEWKLYSPPAAKLRLCPSPLWTMRRVEGQPYKGWKELQPCTEHCIFPWMWNNEANTVAHAVHRDY